MPHVSVRRFAALPVGAHKAIVFPMRSIMDIMVFIMVVFPVPGPPVIINMPFMHADIHASRCCCDKIIAFSLSTEFNMLSIFSRELSGGRHAAEASLFAVPSSAL